MTAYYNEIEPFAAKWLRNLIHAGHIAPGIVDERSIEDVHPSDLKGFTQCHFFAGIGVWSYALRRAGWPDDRSVWTGSCPCQPFSAAGQGAGFADERHLWPAFFHLISECRPTAVFGEQVASKDAGPWIDLVHADLEAMGYAFGAVPFPSASVGAPHIRDRLYWVANAAGPRLQMRECANAKCNGVGPNESGESCVVANALESQWGRRPDDGALLRNGKAAGRIEVSGDAERGGGFGDLADTARSGRREEHAHAGGLAFGNRAQGIAAGSVRGGGAVVVGDTEREGLALSQRIAGVPGGASRADQGQTVERAGAHAGVMDSAASAGLRLDGAGPTNGFWRDADWIFCRDGKWRPVEPGTQPLAHGAPARVGRLRAYGNAINAMAAEVFIEAAMREAA